jgi:hypothetical protein
MNSIRRIAIQLVGGVAGSVIGGIAGLFIGAVFGAVLIGNYETGGRWGALAGLVLGSSFGVFCGMGKMGTGPSRINLGVLMMATLAGAALLLSLVVAFQDHELLNHAPLAGVTLFAAAPAIGAILGLSLAVRLNIRFQANRRHD